LAEKVFIKQLEGLSVNECALQVVKEMIQKADNIDVEVLELKNRTTVIDAGVNVNGGYRATEYVVKTVFCGFGEARITAMRYGRIYLPTIVAYVDLPVIIGISLYVWAGVIPPPHVDTNEYTAWVSGPGKALSQSPEKVYEKLDYKDQGNVSVLIVQPRDKVLPDEKVADKLASACGISPENLYLIVTPSNSIVGTAQVSARTLEDGFWRLTEYYGVSYDRIKQMMTTTPIAPISSRVFKEPCVWADDMIRYGGVLHAWIHSLETEDLQRMAEETVIENNPASFGKSFYQLAVVERKYIHPDYDLHAIAKEGRGFVMAEVCLYDTRTGLMHRAGRVHDEIIEKLMSRPW